MGAGSGGELAKRGVALPWATPRPRQSVCCCRVGRAGSRASLSVAPGNSDLPVTSAAPNRHRAWTVGHRTPGALSWGNGRGRIILAGTKPASQNALEASKVSFSLHPSGPIFLQIGPLSRKSVSSARLRLSRPTIPSPRARTRMRGPWVPTRFRTASSWLPLRSSGKRGAAVTS